MNKSLRIVALLFLAMSIFFPPGKVMAQGVPELIYYKFDTPGTTTQNFASAPVGTGPGTVNGATIGGTGQFSSALLGTGGATASNSVNANWPLNLSGPWTMSMWISGVTNTLSSNYLFGGSGGTTFRALTGSGVVAGAGNLMIRSTGMTDVVFNNIFDATGTPVVIHLVYDPTTPAIRGYVNGVLNVTVAQPAALTFTGTDFTVGGQASSTGLPTGGKIDEFRLYNRALTQAEISTTWNVMLPYAVSPNDGGVTAITAPGTPIAPGTQNIQVKIKNYGTSPLTSAQIGWKVNNTVGTPFAFTGNLATNAESAPITIGNFNFPVGSHRIKAWVTNPNGATDGNHFNDTTTFNLIACNIVSGTFTINKGAPASATNFQSFTSAIQALANCGVSGPVTYNVVAGSGPYNEQVTIPAIAGVSATNTITFNGNGNTLEGTSTAGTPTLKLDGADYIRVNNLIINSEATATAGQVVHLTNGSDNNIFTGNTINHVGSIGSTSTSYPVYIYSGSNNNNKFQNNTIIGGYYSIYNYGASGGTQANNQFIGNTIKDPYIYGIYNYYAPGTLIEGNDISRPTRTNGGSLYAIYITTGSTEVTVNKNRIHNTHDVATTASGTVYAIYVGTAGTLGTETIIKNNAIYNINNSGGALYAFYNSGGNNTYYFHNTVSADDPAVNYATLRGMYFLSASTNVKFMNNNISLSSPAASKYAIYLSSTTIALQSNGNNLYAPNGNVGYYSANQATLANWKAVNSNAYDQASVSADPMFVNRVTGDLKPTNSTLNNVGVALTPAVTDDITGATRSTTTPDPGAYEFVPAANDAGITSIVSPTSPVQPNTSLPVTVTLKNFGLSPLTAVTITWSINGTAQTPYNWTGNLANNTTANVTLGNYSYPAGSYALNICTSNPNGVVDANPGNDCQSMTVISCAALTGTYTINKAAAASATNFVSFTSAVNTLNSCGVSGAVTINVVAGSGPYNETIEMMNVSGSSATNTITFNGNSNTLTSPLASADAVIKLNGAKYIRFNNLTIEANSGTTGGTVVSLINAANNNTFNGNTIVHSTSTTSTSQAVYLYTGSSNNTFQNNTITGSYYGIYNYGASGTTNDNNSFIGNTIKDFYYYGIYNYYGTGTLIQANDISRPTRTNAGFMYGIYASTGSTGLTISRNRIHNTHDVATTKTGTVYGIYIGAAGTLGTETMIKNNAIYNINNDGGSLYAFYNSGGNNTYYYHNTVAADDASVNYATLRGMYFLSASTNVKFMNNIISLGSPAGTKHAIYLGSTTIALQSNNNDLYAPTGNVGYYGSAMATLADWKAANSGAYDQASVSVDPMFAGVATGNLQPTSVGVNNIGTPLAAVTDDLLGNPRSATTPDLGAVEFTLNPNDVGVVAISGPVSGCGLTASQAITATIKNFGTATQTSVPLTLKVGTNVLTATPEVWTGSLAPNATATHTFTVTANLATAGFYKIVAGTLLTGDSNNNNNNDTLDVTNALMAGLPVLNYETVATGINAMRLVKSPKSNISESAAASLPFSGQPTTSTKGMLMEGTNASGWLMPVGLTDPWTNNPDHFSGAYICFSPSSAPAGSPLWLAFDLKQTFKTANANTNFRVTIDGVQVGPTYRPPFAGTPIEWQKIYIDLGPYRNQQTIQIGLESSVSEPYANGAGPANLIDNARVVAFNPTGVADKVFQSSINVYPNPSNGVFSVTVPTAKAYTLEVTDLTGRVISKEVIRNSNTAQLNLQNQAKGVYLLKITSEGNSAVQKLIVE